MLTLSQNGYGSTGSSVNEALDGQNKMPSYNCVCSQAYSSGHGSCYHDRCPPKKAGQPQSVDGTNDDLCWLLRTATSAYGSPLTVRLLVAFNPLRWRRCTPKKKSKCTRSLIPGSERTVGNTSNNAVLLEVRLISCDNPGKPGHV